MNPPPTPALGGTRAARIAQRVFPLAVLLLVATYGAVRLGAFVAAERAGWAPAAAVAFALVLLAILTAGAVARASFFELALGGLAWCLGAGMVCQLSPYPTALRAGGGPYQAPVYLALTLASGLYAVGWPRFLARPPSEYARACLLLLMWTTADGRMLERPRESMVPLLAAAALLVLGMHARLRGKEWLSGPGRPLVVVLGALVAWWAVATACGDSVRTGITSFSYLLAGVLLAWALAGSLDERGAHRAVVGLVIGFLASFALLIASVLEMLPYNDLGRIFGSRLRLFDTYPNQIAPLFAGGACLLIPLARGRFGQRSAIGLPRWLVVLTLVGCVGALFWTRSRGGMAAFLVGAAVAVAASGGHLPRRPVRVAVAAAVLVAAGVALFLSPLGSGLRDELDRRTFGQSAIGQRYHYWRSASSAVAEHPWLGVGPGQYYAHARYAEPSYYDGSLQEVHPHSLLLAVAESAGIPGLILFALFAVGLLELGRRRVLAARSEPERYLWAGLCGAVVASLAANLFDLTTGSTTLIPLMLWAALGLFSAGSGSAAPRSSSPSRSPLACALAALLLVPLTVMPLAGRAAATWGDVLLARGEDWRAGRLFQLASRVHPWNARAVSGERVACQRMLQGDRVLELMEAETRAMPGRMGAWLEYGKQLLLHGRAEEALPVLERAAPLDPRGPRTGELAMLRAWAQLELGNEAEARARLLEAMSLPGGDWRPLPQEVLPPRPGDPSGAARIAFRLGGEGGRVPFDDVLEELGRRVLAGAEEDHVAARRLLGRVVEGYVAESLAGAALDLVRRYSELVEPMASIQVTEVELLGRLRDFEGAAEAYHASPYVDHPYMTAAYLRATRDSPDPEQQREFTERPLEIGGGWTTDLYFSAEVSAPVYGLEAERALARGDWAAARRFHRRALYHLNTPLARGALAGDFFVRAVKLDAPDDLLVYAVATLTREVSRLPAHALDPERLGAWAELLRGAWSGDLDRAHAELATALRGSGAAGQAFLEAWSATVQE